MRRAVGVCRPAMAVRFFSHRQTPTSGRGRWFVVSGGYAAFDSSPPARTTANPPSKIISCRHSGELDINKPNSGLQQTDR